MYFKILKLSLGFTLGKLTASYFPTLAPEGVQTRPRNPTMIIHL